MSLKENFELLGRYNRWMNGKVYDAASHMPPADLHADRGAFFGSIFGTLNHILVADTLWLKRFANHGAAFTSLRRLSAWPMPTSLSGHLHPEFDEMKAARETMDAIIVAFTLETRDIDYDTALTYTNTSGQTFTRQLAQLTQHFFNHQTHHRGQATTLLSQSGIDVGVTDLVMMAVEEDRNSNV